MIKKGPEILVKNHKNSSNQTKLNIKRWFKKSEISRKITVQFRPEE